jgi:hypothetical protein
MDWEEWIAIVAKLNSSFPGQQIEEPMAREWFGELRGFPAGEVWLAVRRCRREREFMPGLAAILEAIDANHRELMEDRRQAAAAMQARPPGRRGVPMPIETKQAIQILDARLKGELGGPSARLMIEALADQLEARVHARPETVRDATRLCPECATSAVAGWVDVPEDGVTAVLPCPMCQPGRHDAWKKGRLTAKAGQDGYPVIPAGANR